MTPDQYLFADHLSPRQKSFSMKFPLGLHVEVVIIGNLTPQMDRGDNGQATELYTGKYVLSPSITPSLLSIATVFNRMENFLGNNFSLLMAFR